MPEGFYYLLSFLPPLPDIGDSPPITMAEVAKLARETPGNEVRCVFEAIELEGILHRLIDERLMISNDSSEIHDFAGLPKSIADLFDEKISVSSEGSWLTDVWMRFYDHIAQNSERRGSKMLVRWSTWEKTLREQLAVFRTQNMGKDGLIAAKFSEKSEINKASRASRAGRAGMAIEGIEANEANEANEAIDAIDACEAIEGSEPKEALEYDHSLLIQEFSKVENPLTGEEILDRARIRFLEGQAERYSFKAEELIAYVLKLRLILRHSQMNRDKGVKILMEVTSE